MAKKYWKSQGILSVWKSGNPACDTCWEAKSPCGHLATVKIALPQTSFMGGKNHAVFVLQVMMR